MFASGDDWSISHDKILGVIRQNKGSISKPSANALKLQVGKLRILIEQMGLEDEVNHIRKEFKRRPAAFKAETDDEDWTTVIYEKRLPTHYR